MDNHAMIEWVKEVNRELKETRKAVIESEGRLMQEISRNREEFVIFKTRVSVRTAMISSLISTGFLLAALIVNIGSIKERIENRALEDANKSNTEYVSPKRR